jgi:hypothetical protein
VLPGFVVPAPNAGGNGGPWGCHFWRPEKSLGKCLSPICPPFANDGMADDVKLSESMMLNLLDFKAIFDDG